MSKERFIDLDKEQFELLRTIIRRHIPGKTVWAYGSRVAWKAGETSDLDLAVFGCDSMEIYDLKEALEESDLLISVDVMDWESMPDDFKENIRGKYVVLQERQSKPEGWEEVRLGDVIDVKHGYAFKGQYIADQENNNILVTPGNFKIGGGFKSSKLKYFTGQVPQDYILKEDDIIVTMTDLSKNGDTLGYSAKVPETKTGKKFLHNQRIGLLQFKSNVVDQDFIYWLLRTSDYHWFIVGAASGTSIKHTSPTAIKEYKFSFPPLPEQKAIAEVLSSLDDKIDLLHRQNKTLEDMAQTLFREWFVNELDDTWEHGKLGDVLTVKGGTTPSTREKDYWDGDIHWTTPKDLSNHNAIFLLDTEKRITERGLAKISSGLLPIGSVLLSSRAPVGYLAITDINLAINQGYIAIVCDKMLSNYFVYLWCKKNLEIIKNASGGSVFQEIPKSVFRQIDIAIPPEKILSSFDQLIKPVFQKVKYNQYQIRKLQNLRDVLLPKLMNGSVSLKAG